jgi:Spy/CpxP family protein refolding chaperone
MNKFIITIISTLMLSVTGTAAAQDAHGNSGERSDRGTRHQNGPKGNPFLEQALRGIRSLDLSDVQKTNIKSIVQSLKAESAPITKETKSVHMQLRTLITAPTYDAASVADLAETEGALATERLILSSRALSDIYAELTAEQRTRLDAMSTDRMAKRSEKEEKRKRHPSED